MSGDGKIGLWAVVAIGVGGMVGGGIFAVLGLAVQMAHGRSIDTSMGFTPTAGVPMCTRSGDMDPGLVSFCGATNR